MRRFSLSRAETWLLVGVVLIHVVSCLVALHRGTYTWPDSVVYQRLARHLLELGVYSQQPAPPLIPDTQRLPGYPVFLAALANQPEWILPVQHVLVFVAAWGVFRLARRCLSPPWARAAAWVWLLQPYTWWFPSLLLTEVLFLTLTIWLLVGMTAQPLRFSRTCFLALGTLVLVYIKGLGLVLAGVWGAVCLWHIFVRNRFIRNTKENGLLHGLVFFGILALGVLPWMHRNEQITGRFTLSTLSETAFWYGRVGGLLAWQSGAATDEQTLVRLTDSLAATHLGETVPVRSYRDNVPAQEAELIRPEVLALGRRYLLSHPVDYGWFQLRCLGQMWLGVSYRTALAMTGCWGCALLSAALQGGANLLMMGGCVVYVWRIRRLAWPVHLCMLTVLGYLGLHAAVWADGRYRLIADPLLAFITAAALQNVSWYSSRFLKGYFRGFE